MPRVKLFDEKEVLNKAMCLFWKQGFAATSVQDLVSYLGINRASLYDTFGDKEQLFKKAFEHYLKTNAEALTCFLKAHPNVKEGFSKLLNSAVAEAVEDSERKGCFVVNTTTALIPGDEKLLPILEANKKRILGAFHDYLKQGAAAGQLQNQQDLEALATLLYTIYNGIRVVSKVKPDQAELSASIAVAMSLLN